MTRSKLLITVGVVLAVVVALCVALVISKRPSDCDTVRSMIAHNNEFNAHIESAAARNIQTTTEEVRDNAAHLRQLAEQVRDPALAEHADRLAALADQGAAYNEQFQADEATVDPDSPPPPYIQDYGRVAKEFDETLATLDRSCPA